MKKLNLQVTLTLILLSVSVFGQNAEIVMSNENPVLPVFTLSVENKLQFQDDSKLNDHYFMVRERLGVISKIPVSVVYGTTDDQRITLKPLTELGWGLDFRVIYIENDDTMYFKYRTPDKKLEENPELISVLATYPTASKLPRNILFFHIQFNTPMIEDIRAYQYVRLFNNKGEEIPNIWRHKSFWLNDGHILVLMIHPGRVKRGIKMDNPFLENQTYKLKLDSGLMAVNGNTTVEIELKKFLIKADDYQIPSIDFNRIILPKVNSIKSLVIEFSEGMDFSSIIDGVKIYCDEKRVTGIFFQKDSDTKYQFYPEQKWRAGKYVIIFEKKVCDFSGNRLTRPFEIQNSSDLQKDKDIKCYSFIL